MPSRRDVLATVGIGATAGVAGCVDRIHDVFDSSPAVTGSCDDPGWTWPTAGGDRGRTGTTDTAPPAPDADSVDLLAGIRDDDHQPLASSLPAVADGMAYVPSGSGIVAVDLDTPAEGAAWVQDLDDDVDAMPALACGVVLASGLNQLAAIDRTTGEPYWRADVGGHDETSVASLGETAYVAGVNPTAVDVRRGQVQWSATGGDTVALDDSGVYTTENANGSGSLFAHDLDGEERWQLALGKIVGSASVHDGTVFVADNQGTVYAIDAATGKTFWSYSLRGVERVQSGLAVRGDDVVVPAGDGETSAVLDCATGEPRWTVDTGIVTGRPVVGDDWVAFGRTNIGITVYERATGEKRTTWSREGYNLGTVDGLVPVEDGFVVRGGTTSGLSLIR